MQVDVAHQQKESQMSRRSVLQAIGLIRRRLRIVIAVAALAMVSAPALAVGINPAMISLETAIDDALDANLEVVSARNAVRSAAAGVRTADTFLNPVFSIGSTAIRPGRFGDQGFSRTGDDVIRIDQPIERGGKRRARVAAARDALAAAGGDVADTKRQVRATVTGAWFDLMAQEQRLNLYSKIADSYRDGMVLADRRLAAGAISAGDLARQRVEMLRAQSDQSRAMSDRREAQLALAVLIGREADAAALETVGSWRAAPAVSTLSDPEAVADSRADVRAADLRVSEARHALDGARALRHPDITVGAQYEYDANGTGSSVGLGVAIPLQIGNRYGGVIDAAGVDLGQAEANAAKVRAVAIAEIRTARQAATDASARRARYDDDLLPSARKAAGTAEFAYARGGLALLDLLDARRILQAVELGAIDAHADEAKALARRAAAETPEE